jgi:hypothetical protein
LSRSGIYIRGGLRPTIHHRVSDNLVLVDKVNIDADSHRYITEATCMTILDLVLDAKCDKNCNQGLET